MSELYSINWTTNISLNKEMKIFNNCFLVNYSSNVCITLRKVIQLNFSISICLAFCSCIDFDSKINEGRKSIFLRKRLNLPVSVKIRDCLLCISFLKYPQLICIDIPYIKRRVAQYTTCYTVITAERPNDYRKVLHSWE